MAEEHDPPPPPEPPLSAGHAELQELLLSLPETVAASLRTVGDQLEFELRGIEDALGGARAHAPVGSTVHLPAADQPAPEASLWGGPPVYLAPDPGEAGEPLWSGHAELSSPGAWLDPPAIPAPGSPARTVAPELPAPPAEATPRTATPEADPWWHDLPAGEGLSKSTVSPWWAEAAGEAQRAEVGLPPGAGDAGLSGSAGGTVEIDSLPGEAGGGGADILGVLERIAGLLERLVEASEEGEGPLREVPGPDRVPDSWSWPGGEDFHGTAGERVDLMRPRREPRRQPADEPDEE
jgi:hypothetical protein